MTAVVAGVTSADVRTSSPRAPVIVWVVVLLIDFLGKLSFGGSAGRGWGLRGNKGTARQKVRPERRSLRHAHNARCGANALQAWSFEEA